MEGPASPERSEWLRPNDLGLRVLGLSRRRTNRYRPEVVRQSSVWVSGDTRWYQSKPSTNPNPISSATSD